MLVPDLLNNCPEITIDAEALEETLTFAFITGRASKTIEDHLKNARVENDGNFEASCFEKDLFLDQFIEDCFHIKITRDGRTINPVYLKKLLTRPPTDPKIIEFRQSILRELTSKPEYEARFKDLYKELWKLAMAFNTASYTVELNMTEFRMDVLSQLKKVIEIMASSFAHAESGLRRIHESGRLIKQTPDFSQLADLLDYEANLAKIELSVRVGSMGDLKGVKILSINENLENQHYVSPLGRIFEKLKLLVRGYRFSDYDLTAKLVEKVFLQLEKCLVPFVQLFGHVEFYLASLSFRDLCQRHGLPVCLPELIAPEDAKGIQLEQIYNPLLFRQGVTPASASIHHRGSSGVTLITGPNSGGKTRLLQALGISQLLGQSGLFVPAASARIRPVSAMYVSLIEADTVDQDEGRLGTELKRIRTLFEQSRMGAMVILDELCSGTNPSEGSEIVALVLELLAKLKPTAYITTHFLDFAQRIHREKMLPHMEFYQVELNSNDEPTYGFIPGVASSSLARKIAARLGVTREELADLIRQKGVVDLREIA